MTHDEQSARKDVGGFVGGALEGGRRTGGAVTERWLVTLDADEARSDDWETYETLCSWPCALYSTHSHTPESPRLRWVFPLKRAVTPEEYGAVSRRLASDIGLLPTLDPSTFQPERLMYWPSCPEDGEYIFETMDGSEEDYLDPDKILAEYGPGRAWADVALWPMSDRERDIIIRSARKQGDPTAKPGIVGAWCRYIDVPGAIDRYLSDVYERCEGYGGTRYTYRAGHSSAGAVLYEDGAFLYSHHSTDPAGERLLNSFDLVRLHKFGAMDDGSEAQEVTRLPSYKAMCDFAAADEEFKAFCVQERLDGIRRDFEDMGSDTAPGAGAEVRVCAEDGQVVDTDDRAWMKGLVLNSKTGKPEPTVANIRLLINHTPELAGRFAYDLFQNRVVVTGDLPWRRRGKEMDGGDYWADVDDAGLREFMETHFGISAPAKIQDGFALVCEDHSFHPVRAYLDSLTWDGVERLDTMLVRWMGAEDSAYTRAVTRKWACAGVARIYEPGRKFDAMLMLVGPQGAGKSKLAMALSRGWFSDSLSSTEGKDAYDGLKGRWIIEFAELAATRKSEVENVKNFISKQEDTYRPAYARYPVTYRRQCIFYGTTNDAEFLRDKTGNRRFWPVQVTGFDNGQLLGFEAEVDQLWAEAKTRYRAGEPLWLSDAALQTAAREQQERFAEQDELYGMVEEYLDKLLPDDWDVWDPMKRRDYFHDGVSAMAEGVRQRTVVCLSEIRNEMLGQDAAELVRNDVSTRRLAGVMNNMQGWTKLPRKKSVAGYGQQWCYAREEYAGEVIREYERRKQEFEDAITRAKAEKS
jgi:predicted P-loop ATPase